MYSKKMMVCLEGDNYGVRKAKSGNSKMDAANGEKF
jgi:hypothetical protein